MTPIQPATLKNNRRVLAAQLRRRANRIDRQAWLLEEHATRLGPPSFAGIIKNLRHDAQALRRLADELAPKARR